MPVKKGNIPWNKGKSGYETQEQIESRVSKFRGRKHTEQEHIKMSLGHMGHIVSLESRKKQSISRGRHNHIDWSDLRELYVNQKLSTPKIGMIKNCQSNVVYTQLKHQHIPIRNLSEANMGELNPQFGKTPSSETKALMRAKLAREKNPAWRGGTRRAKYDIEFSEEQKEKIRKRDDYTCQLCGVIQNGLRFDIHHIDYNRQHSYNNNLITLCHSCHCRTNHHRDYWQTNLTWLMSLIIAT